MADFTEGQTATNPKTGQKVVFKGGQWVNAGVSGGGSAGPVSTAGSAKEQARFNTFQDAGSQARSMIRNLLTAKMLNNHTPTGFIEGPVQGVKRAFGSDSVPTLAREQMDAVANNMVMSYRQPGTGTVSDTEREMLRKSLFSSNYQRASNRAIIGSRVAEQFANLATAKLAATWRAKVGSLDARSPKGMTFDQALSVMNRSPSFRAGMQRARTIDPDEYVNHGESKVIDFHELPE